MPDKIHSKAQMRFLFAEEGRGGLPKGKAAEMARAEGPRRLAHLPEHVERAFLGHLIRKYFGGGEAGPHHFGYEHDEARGDYESDGHEACQHFAHGGASDRHDPGCPGHPMYGGGFAHPEDEDESEESFEADERRATGLRPAGDLRGLARGGRAAVRHHAHGGYAQGGQSEDEAQVLAGSDWQSERNRPRSPLAARLSGARIGSRALRLLLSRPATRVP